MKRLITALCALVLALPVTAQAVTLDSGAVPPRTQMTLRVAGGPTVATANADEARPALSLAKLYLGHWVLHHGSPEHAARVENMIRYSEDGTASLLDAAYPQAIDATAAAFGLHSTHRNGFWGHATTSTNDVTAFLLAIQTDPVSAPLIHGMNTAAPVAADGYRQDYGTSRVPGVTGTKFGWSDDGTINATASIGLGFSIAAHTYGPPQQLTDDVFGAVTGDTPAGAPGGTPAGIPAVPGLGSVDDALDSIPCPDLLGGADVLDSLLPPIVPRLGCVG